MNKNDIKFLSRCLSKLRQIEIDETSGIYILFRGDEMVYIGQSGFVHNRINTQENNIDFSHASFIHCPNPDERAAMEKRLINYFKPKLNSTFSKEE